VTLRSTSYRLIPALVLVVVAAWSTCRIEGAPDGVPGDAAWREAAAAVRARHHAGDLIVFAPAWVDPVGRLHLGDLIPVEMAARMDADRHGTIWELSIRGARAPESRGLTPAWQGSFGGVSARLFERPPIEVATDLVAAFASGSVRVDGPRARGPSVEVAEVGFAPRRCVQVVPQPGRTVTMTWPGVEVGRELVGYVGLADVFTRRDVRDPGELAVRIGGREVARVRVGVDDGWVRFAAPTTPGRGDVVVEATAVGERARDRLICFAAEARR
jgi:hypothetical protein